MTKKAKPKPESTTRGGGEPPSKSYEKVIANWTMILGISTVALVIATGVSAYFLYETDLTLSRTAERQIRAYLVAEPESVKRFNRHFAVEITVRNVGQTPAYKVLNRASGGVFDFPFKQGQVPIGYATKPISGSIFGGPIQSTVTLGRDRTHSIFTEALYDANDIGVDDRILTSKRLVAAGAIYYTDIFGKARYTRFCFYIFDATPVIISQCHQHNDAN